MAGFKTTGTVRGGVKQIHALTAAYTIVQEDSGKIFTLDADGQAITLPAATTMLPGTNFKFIVVETLTSSWVITSGADDLHGMINSVTTSETGALAAATPLNILTFATSAGENGDWCEMVTDGILWYLSGQSELTANVTLTT